MVDVNNNQSVEASSVNELSSAPSAVQSGATATEATTDVARRPFKKSTDTSAQQSSAATAESAASKAPVSAVEASGAATAESAASKASVSAGEASSAATAESASSKASATTTDKASANYSFSYISRNSLAYAQLQSTFKTGTNNDGKFIYSDIIANKCGMNFDEISEEKVAECVKIWVLGMNDANAETAAEWKDLYKNALHDHVASDVNKALEQKNYSANFDTEIADDLENKADALTNEREEVSFSGQVSQVNQEIIIRLMEAQTGQVVTESLSAVNSLERDYYDEADDEE